MARKAQAATAKNTDQRRTSSEKLIGVDETASREEAACHSRAAGTDSSSGGVSGWFEGRDSSSGGVSGWFEGRDSSSGGVSGWCEGRDSSSGGVSGWCEGRVNSSGGVSGWCEGRDNSWSPNPFGAISSTREVDALVLQVLQVA